MNNHDNTSWTSFPQPVMGDIGVIGLVPEEWETPWMARHHVLTRLANYFHVVWCNPAHEWRSIWPHRIPRHQTIQSKYSPNLGFHIYSPGRWLPLFYRPALVARFTERKRLEKAKRILARNGCKKVILYIWRPHFESALNMIEHDLSCYHIDDEYSFSDQEKRISETEKRLLSRVHQVFIHSPALLEKKGHINTNTLFVPNGVNYRAYSTQCEVPPDLEPIPHPRIGYVGYIKEHLDLPLLISLAKRHPGWSFVFVGPFGNLGNYARVVQELSGMQNVYFLGEKAVKDLPAYTQHLDVCMMCYRLNDYTKFIYPLKLHEYLASGRPVVGTPIRSLRDYAQIINLATTTEEWSQALTDSLAPESYHKSSIEARRKIARKNDWDHLVGIIAQTMCSRLGKNYTKRFNHFQLDKQ